VRNDSVIAREFLTHGRSDSCPIVDMHGHYGTFAGIYFPNPYADRMQQSMDRAGVKAIVCSSHLAMSDQALGNRELAQALREHPGRFYGYRIINPHYPEVAKQEVERYPLDPGFVGFKFHPDGHSYPITGSGYEYALSYANEQQLLVLTHSWGESKFDSPHMVAEVAKKYPQVTFIMGHAGYGEWDIAFAAAREHSNIYLDLCAAYRVNGIIARMVNEVGSHKIVFGTDQPWFDPHACAGSICYSRITDEDRRNICYRNAEKLLKTVT
jgi:uncharacterized protein